MKVKFCILLSIVACFSFILLGCPAVVTPPATDGTTDAAAADKLADEAVALMKAQDWDGALTKFSEAVTKDPSNGRAVLGYSALNIAGLMADPNIVTLAKDKLGFASYPSTMNKVLVPSNWMDQLQSPYGGMFPTITNQLDYDGDAGTPADGILDPDERMIAFVAWFASHNTGFDALATTVGTVLGTRLDTAITAIKAVGDSAQLTLTWDMFSSTAPTEGSWWPFNASHQPMSIVIGKAELLTLASSMEMVRGFTYLAQVYSLTLPLADYWASFNPINGTGTNPTQKPFDTFLQLTAGATTQMAGAKASYTAATSDFSSAVTMVLANRAGFFLSTDAATGIFTDPAGWSNFTQSAKIARRAAQEVNTSLTNSTLAYFPFSMGTANPDAWPTAIDPGVVMGLNYGLLFSAPIDLFQTLINLSTNNPPAGEAAGEPLYYDLSGTTFATVDNSFFPSNDFTGNEHVFYIMIPDITFSGATPVSNFPMDNPATLGSLQIYYDDANSSGKWDPGEVVASGSYTANVDGFVNPASLTYGGNPTSYFRTVPDGLLANYTTAGNYAALRSALSACSNFSVSVFAMYLSGTALYIPIAPSYLAWNSFTQAGVTTGIDPYGKPMTSAGSIWWALANMIPRTTPPS
jgi:hypothetical protein